MVKMFYFGPWDRAGHFWHDEHGHHVLDSERQKLPWGDDADGQLQPHRKGCTKGAVGAERYCSCRRVPEGHALIHHKDGWTALSFWDRSVDTRDASNSTYIAEGTFTFLEMARMAKERFAERWNKHIFVVVDVTPVRELKV